MRGNRREEANLLARVNFPLYSVKTVTERHILVGGGGGAAKTGISNTIEVYELINDRSTNSCRANRVAHYDTGSRAMMNGAVFEEGEQFALAVGGSDGLCQMYKMRTVLTNGHEPHTNGITRSASPVGKPRERCDSGEGLRRRRTSSTSSASGGKENNVNSSNVDPNQSKFAVSNGTKHPTKPRDAAHQTNNVANNPKKQNGGPSKAASDDEYPNIGFELVPTKAFQTDFHAEEPFQKVIRYSPVHSLLVTGGADGHIRLWKYPEIRKLGEFKAHEDEVDDLDIDPAGQRIVSISRDGHGYVWNCTNGAKACELEYLLPVAKNATKPIKYNFRACRFGLVEGEETRYKLFTILNPVIRQKPPNPSYLCKWDTQKFIVEKMVSTGPEVLSSMTVSDDGRFIGLGTLSGSVDVFIAFSLQRLYHLPRAHNIFVTGVEFLKSCDATQKLTGDKDASLVSISVDNHIVIHHIPKQATLGFLGSSMMLAITLLVMYIIMDFLGL